MGRRNASRSSAQRCQATNQATFIQLLLLYYIIALRRFIARRGRISVLNSDNGTNFVGTNNALSTLDWDKIVVYSTAQKLTWKFIPPAAVWWGGWGERIVRMLKELLRRVLGKSIVNYEELLISVCDCESIINARPLTFIHEDPNELLL
ncbi:integrase catalytic domain-containing protein [Trichonephila clavipes]|nr:integrase catalytic domain-containing protein [Trichonephila clavipes]